MKQKILLILLSLGYTILPSLFISLAIGLINGKYLATFLISFALIFLLGIFQNTWLTNKTLVKLSQLDYQKKELASKQAVEVTCAYCKERNIVPIWLSIRNVFDCKQCKKSNVIIFQFATAQITVPLEIGQIGVASNV